MEMRILGVTVMELGSKLPFLVTILLALTSTLCCVTGTASSSSVGNLDAYRCDNLVGFKGKNFADFAYCCGTFPTGAFICPKLAFAGHVCGISHPPKCCQLQCQPAPPQATTSPPVSPTEIETEAEELPPKESQENESEEDEEDD